MLQLGGRPLACVVAMLLAFACAARAADAPAASDRLPNVVLIVADDLGYGDLGAFGATDIRTPHIDAVAREGTRFTSFYVAQAVCTASRAAMMTGCYPNRISLYGALNHITTSGIAAEEFLLPEAFKQRGYATAIFGKWHLGTPAAFNPLRHGFDEFFGLPYSNDNGKFHPTVKDLPPLPLMDGEKTVALEPDQSQFTKQFTERSAAFIEKNKDRPFFLYVPHVMPHVPIFASADFKGRSKSGLYGDTVEELDWSVGQIMAALKKLRLDEKTLVIFTSDNGPFLSYGTHAGSSGKFREGKLTTFEGGVRMPCIMRLPGTVPAGRTCDEPIAAIDLLPTLAKMIGVELPKDRIIDGKDIGPLIAGQTDASSPHEALYFYAGDALQAIRSGKWKLHLPHPYLTVDGPPGTDGKPANYANMKPQSHEKSGLEGIASRHGYRIEQIELSLFDLEADPGETKNVAKEHAEVVERMMGLAEKARADLGDSLTGRKGANVRPAGKAE